MAVVKLGRFVIDPDLRERLHKAIRMKGMTMMVWFESTVQKDFLDISNPKPNT